MGRYKRRSSRSGGEDIKTSKEKGEKERNDSSTKGNHRGVEGDSRGRGET